VLLFRYKLLDTDTVVVDSRIAKAIGQIRFEITRKGEGRGKAQRFSARLVQPDQAAASRDLDGFGAARGAELLEQVGQM